MPYNTTDVDNSDYMFCGCFYAIKINLDTQWVGKLVFRFSVLHKSSYNSEESVWSIHLEI